MTGFTIKPKKEAEWELFVCNVCQKKFANERYLLQHHDIHWDEMAMPQPQSQVPWWPLVPTLYRTELWAKAIQLRIDGFTPGEIAKKLDKPVGTISSGFSAIKKRVGADNWPPTQRKRKGTRRRLTETPTPPADPFVETVKGLVTPKRTVVELLREADETSGHLTEILDELSRRIKPMFD
jgi:hypothetical protein